MMKMGNRGAQVLSLGVVATALAIAQTQQGARLVDNAFNAMASSVGYSKAVSIPLQIIWAWEMPGTTDIRTLEPKNYGPAIRNLPEQEQIDLMLNSHAHQVYQSIAVACEKRTAGPGFVVSGVGLEALENAKAVLENGGKRNFSLPRSGGVSVFFFAKEYGRYVHIKECKQQGSRITVKYQFIPHASKQLTHHFGLIPLGQLKAGKYSVIFESVPDVTTIRGLPVKPVNSEVREELICKSFEFIIPTAS